MFFRSASPPASLLLPFLAASVQALSSPGLLAQAESPAPRVHERFEIAAEPGWIVPHEVDSSKRHKVESEVGDTYFLLAENQYDVATGTNYFRYLKRLESESALREGSQLSFGFDPAHETLRFHRLRIHRNGEMLDRLAGQEFKVIQREEDHERQLYDDSLSAIAVLEDTRVGDVIEYAFSLSGGNPVFGGHFYWTLTTSYTLPVGIIHGVLRHPSDEEVKIKSHSTETVPVISESGSARIHRWLIDDPAPLPSEGGLPHDYDPWGWVEATSWRSWDEVAEWAGRQYLVPETLPGELETVVRGIEKHESEEQRILAALRFVQDEIRYLGIFEGVHSHKPHPVETIVRRRFGDCKDKTLLLVSILRRLGISSWPALVHTDYRHAVASWSPSPHAFDHLVTAVRVGEKTYWLDPTATCQRGPLHSLFFPDYGFALLVPDSETRSPASLTKIDPQGYGETGTSILERFDLPTYMGDATLEVETVYRGGDADEVRAEFASNARSRIQKNYLNYYSEAYVGIEAAGDIEMVDDEAGNVVRVKESYRIRDLWEEDRDNPKRLEADFSSRPTYNRIDIPSTKNRTMPYAIDHPVNVVHELEIRLPDPMTDEEEEHEVTDPAFTFSFRERYEGPVTKLRYHYRSLQRRIEPERIDEYLGNARDAEDLTDYNLWISRDLHEGRNDGAGAGSAEAGFRPHWPMVLVIILSIGFGALLALALAFVKPQSNPGSVYVSSLDGISGWLILVAIGVWIRPLIGPLLTVVAIHDNDVATWQAHTSPEGAEYHPNWALFRYLEASLESFQIPVAFLLPFLFHGKRRLFVPVMIGLMSLELATSVLFYALAASISGVDSDLGREYAGYLRPAIFGAAVWIPYFLVSKRVASTFRRGVRFNPPPLPASLIASRGDTFPRAEG